MTDPPAPDRASPRWGTARRWVVDALVALAVGASQVGGTYAVSMHTSQAISPGGYALLALGPAALVARRRFPVAVLATCYVTTLWYATSSNSTGPVWNALIVAFGTAIYYRKRVAALSFLVVGYVGFLWGPTLISGRPAPTAAFALALAVGLAVLLGVSEGIRLRQERAAAVARSRTDEALRRASEERLRVARDLHDVVAHSIAVINVQANTALHLMDRQPDRARLALSTINDVSKQALVELRSVLGVLRQVDEDAPRAPSPTLADLDGLVARAAGAGLVVRMEHEGDPPPMPASVEMAAYRIIQEGLTNAARHSGGSTAMVRICFGESGAGESQDAGDGAGGRSLVVQIDDDGTSPPPLRVSGFGGASAPDRARAPGRAGGPAGGSGPGNGIVGMRERAQALGGRLEAGPRPGGGFRVRASLPLTGVMPLNATTPGGTQATGGTAAGEAAPGEAAAGGITTHDGTTA